MLTKALCPSKFQKFFVFWQMMAKLNGQFVICDVLMLILEMQYFDVGVEGDTEGARETYN